MSFRGSSLKRHTRKKAKKKNAPRGREEETTEGQGERQKKAARAHPPQSFLGDFPPRGSSATLKPAASIFYSPSLFGSRSSRFSRSSSLAHPSASRRSLHLAQPWSSAFYLLATFFHPLAKETPSFQSLLYSSGLFSPLWRPFTFAVARPPPRFRRPRFASLIISLVYLFGIFSSFRFLFPSDSLGRRLEKGISAGGVSMPRIHARMIDSTPCSLSFLLSFLIYSSLLHRFSPFPCFSFFI